VRWEVEVFGVVARLTLGQEAPVEYAPVEYVTTPERLHVADATHAETYEDPAFPNLDWGEDRAGTGEREMDLGRGRGREPDHGRDLQGPFGFQG
jgi:hypothetical protein